MIKKIPNKYKTIAIISFILGLIIALKILAPANEPQIIKSDPANNQTGVSPFTKITLEFDQKISDKNFLISSYPTFKYKISAEGKRLEIEPQGRLMYLTKYDIKITIKEMKNLNFSLTFTTAPGELPPGFPTQSPETQALFYQKFEEDTYREMPLFDYVPFYSENFSLDYTDVLTLKVILKKDTQKNRQEVLDWISSKGVDPTTHKIIWKSQE